MRRSLLSAAAALFALAGGCLATNGEAASPPRLADRSAGWSLEVPAGWKKGGAVAATAFARGARCRSASVVDRLDSGGPGPSEARSFVQVCARAAQDGRTLAAFLSSTYGTALPAQLAPTTFAGRTAYRSRRSDPELVFVQTRSHRLQLAISTTSDPARRAQRQAQVDRALRSFQLRAAG